MDSGPQILAHGPWAADSLNVAWRDDVYAITEDQSALADAAIAALEQRGSPAYDGLAARLVSFSADGSGLRLELQPMRWAMRLVADTVGALSALCVVRSADGRWLAGRRADWVATWAGRWALGAGGAVEVGEDPAVTLARELDEEWSVRPEYLAVESLVGLANGSVMLIGQAWLAADAQDAHVTRDPEHDEHAWWPADPGEWSEAAQQPLKGLAHMLADR